MLVQNQSSEQVQAGTNIDPKYKALSVEAAQGWFEQSFGKTHTFDVKMAEEGNGQSFNASPTTSPVINVTPTWSNARISAYLSDRQVLMVPVNQIEALKKPGVGYSAVFYRDSLGQIAYTLQVLVTTPAYLATHENLSVNDYSGIFLQIRPNGQVKNTLRAVNGRIIGSFGPTTGNALNLLSPPCNCGNWDDMWRAIAHELRDGTSGSPGWSRGEREFYFDYEDFFQNSQNGGSGGGGSSGGQAFPPVNTQIDNTLFDINGQNIKRLYYDEKYVGFGGKLTDDEFRVLYDNKRLFTAVDRYVNSQNYSAQAIEFAREVTAEYQSNIPTTNALRDDFYEDLELFTKLTNESPEFVELCSSLNGLSGGSGNPLTDIIVDLIKDALWEVVKDALSIDDFNVIIQNIKNLTPDGVKKIGFRVLRIVVKNPVVRAILTSTKVVQMADKVNKAYKAFEKIKDIGEDIVAKFSTILKTRVGSVLKNIEWIGGNDGGKIKNVSALDFWDDLARAYGKIPIQNPQNPNEVIFEIFVSGKRVECKFYVNSNTPRGEATISFKITGGSPANLTVKFGFDR